MWCEKDSTVHTSSLRCDNVGMRRLAVGGALAASTLVLVAAAQAKGPNVARICGAAACKEVRGESTLWGIYGWWGQSFSLRGAPRPAPFYRLRLRGGGVTMSLLYVPKRSAMRIAWRSSVPGQGEMAPYWRTVPRDAARRIERFTRDLGPNPTPSRWPR
jgi:hypothetical protein